MHPLDALQMECESEKKFVVCSRKGCFRRQLGISSEQVVYLNFLRMHLLENREKYLNERHDMILNIDNKSITHRRTREQEVFTIYRAKGAKFNTTCLKSGKKIFYQYQNNRTLHAAVLEEKRGCQVWIT
jgi:hypothetical protein